MKKTAKRIPDFAKKLTRDEVLANVLYVDQSPLKNEVISTLRKEGWDTNTQKLLGTHERQYVSPLGGQMQTPRGKFTIKRTR